jgi:aspartyl-tRNA(Asn)/glutamyl-tRNA(Gln) amidotransferase subunit C
MKLEKKDIQHIANLARLELSDKELELYGNQLSDVLGYIDQLQAVDTEGVEPTAQVTGLESVWQEDEVRVWDKTETKNALEQAPEIEKGQVKVKRVLE